MAETWSFAFDPVEEIVEMQRRAEGDGGLVGDVRTYFRPGDESIIEPGLTYDVLAKAGAGTLLIRDDSTFEIIARHQPDDLSPTVTDDEVRGLFHPDLVASAGFKPKS